MTLRSLIPVVPMTCFIALAFVYGLGIGRNLGCRQEVAQVAHLPELRLDVSSATARELERCQALSKRQIEILDEDRELEDDVCNRRVESLVRETYPKPARLVIRSGDHIKGDVGWFVGVGPPPKDTCNPGSLYSRTDGGTLYVCEGSGAWRAK